MRPGLMAAAAAALAASACTSVEFGDSRESVPATAIASYAEGWPAEFSGRTFQIRTRSGITNVVNLAPDGSMTIIPELSTDVVKGKWTAKGDTLCIEFGARGAECWDPAPVVSANGDYVTVRSDRGQELRIRLLNESEEEYFDASA